MWFNEQHLPRRRETHFDGRVVWCFRDRPASLQAMVAAQAAAYPDQQALAGPEGHVTYAQMTARAARIGGGLAAAGVTQGDRVAILMGNRFAFVDALLACQHIGAVAVPMNIRQRPPEIAHALNQCGASGLVFDAGLAGNLPDRGETPALKHLWSAYGAAPDAESFEMLAEASAVDPAEVGEEDPAVILYTSGTTGRPKGAVLTNINIVHSSLHFAYSMEQGAGDRSLLAVPASHVTGLIANLTCTFAGGGCNVILPEFKARKFLELAAAEKVTHTIIVPAMYNLLLLDPELDRFDLSTWRLGAYGGAPMPEATIEALALKLPDMRLMNGYGATEATSPTTMLPYRFALERSDSVGLPLHCAEVAVMDASGCEVGPGETGEIWMRGPHIVPGYWDNPEANAREFVGGWWKSGDIGSQDADGFVRVFDRKKDMINRGGYKIYSIEVENTLAFHPDVLESAIIARPCPVLGERADAVVVTRGAAASDDLADAIRSFCAERLSDYKVPERILFRNGALPRNANGKILKTALRDEYA